jgi:hypothetical protein
LLLFFSPVSDPPVLTLFLVLPDLKSETHVDHAHSFCSLRVSFSCGLCSSLPSKVTFRIAADALVFRIEGDLVSLERRTNVQHVFVWCAISFVNPDSHLALQIYENFKICG